MEKNYSFKNHKDEHRRIRHSQIVSTCAVIIVASFTGFIVENAWLAFRFGYIDNRGMLFPFIFGYGIAIIAVFMLFGLPSNPLFFGKPYKSNHNKDLKYILCIMISVCIGEAGLGKIVEIISGVHWWDYTEVPFHIGQYTSIPTSLGFALIIYLFMKKAFNPICQYANHLDANNNAKIIAVLMGFIIFDYFFSTIFMVRNGGTILTWRKELPSPEQLQQIIWGLMPPAHTP